MSKLVVEYGDNYTKFMKDGFAVYVHDERSRPFAEHMCGGLGDTLLPSEIKRQRCMFCGDLNIPGELLALYQLSWSDEDATK